MKLSSPYPIGMGEGIFRSKSSILTIARFAGEGRVRARLWSHSNFKGAHGGHEENF
jgi:hypothetical protein